MKIYLVIFVCDTKAGEALNGVTMIKTAESDFRPMQGDIIDDLGFAPKFHNGYEVVKVTVNYDTNECYVSIAPLALEVQDNELTDYMAKLRANAGRPYHKVTAQ